MTPNREDQRRGLFRITPVSPLHIGSGQTLTPMDYEIRNGKFIVKDILRFIDAQRDDPAYAMQVVQDRLPIGAEFNRYALPCHEDPRPSSPAGRQDAGEVREFIKDPDGRAYIPGSSLKGCLRTALAWNLVDDMEGDSFDRLFQAAVRERRKPRAFDAFNAALFCGDARGDAKSDVLKALIVRDSQPIDLAARGAMNHVRVMNMMRNGFAPKPGMPIRLESLMPGPYAVDMPFVIQTAIIREDKTLQSAGKGKPAAMLLQPGKLESDLRLFSRTMIDYECGFYKDYCDPNEGAYRFMQQLQQQRNAIYLDLGFGVGWHGKTIGMALDQEQVWQVRNQFRMNDRRRGEFPKTRKWARTPKGYLPLGWIKLEVVWE